MLSATYKSGLRYTPMKQTGVAANGRPNTNLLKTNDFSKIGSPWFWTDLRISEDLSLTKKSVIFRLAQG